MDLTELANDPVASYIYPFFFNYGARNALQPFQLKHWELNF